MVKFVRRFLFSILLLSLSLFLSILLSLQCSQCTVYINNENQPKKNLVTIVILLFFFIHICRMRYGNRIQANGKTATSSQMHHDSAFMLAEYLFYISFWRHCVLCRTSKMQRSSSQRKRTAIEYYTHSAPSPNDDHSWGPFRFVFEIGVGWILFFFRFFSCSSFPYYIHLAVHLSNGNWFLNEINFVCNA